MASEHKSQTHQHVVESNRKYAKAFQLGNLALAPKKKCVIICCMDSRIDIMKVLGFQPGDAHMIRNAGGRASDDAIRSLIISSKLLGTNEFYVIHHTDCGAQNLSEETARKLMTKGWTSTSSHHSHGSDSDSKESKTAGSDVPFIDFLPFKDLNQSVVDDVAKIRAHPLILPSIPIFGFVYDVKTGLLIEVPEASSQGRPRSAL